MAVAAAPAPQSSYVVPGGTSGPMTPAQLQQFGQNFAPGSFGVGQTGAPPQPAPPVQDDGSAIMAKELALFQQNMGQQRSAIDFNLHQALGELGQRRDAAAQVVAGLPQQIASSYNFANGNQNGQVAAAQAGLSPDVRGAAPALNTPFANALAVNRDAGNALAPFLKLGMLANYQSGEAALNKSAMDARAGLDQNAQQFVLSQMDRQAQYAHDNATATQAHDWSVQDRAAQNAAATAAQPAQNPVLAASGLSQGDVNAIKADPAYAHFTAEMSKANPSINAQQVVNLLTNQGPRGVQLLQVLQNENPTFFKSGGQALTHAGNDANAWYYGVGDNVSKVINGARIQT